MEKLKCIIVEDEPLAAEILTDYITQIPFLVLEATYSDALYAMEALQLQKIHVIFLDIHLPKLKGLDFIRTLNAPPQVIITTAYREYALDGYELNVIDYLLKPISFNRFLMAVNKLKRPGSPAPQTSSTLSTPNSCLLITINKKKIKVHLDEILFIESRKEYINILTSGGNSYLTKIPLNEVETQLDKNSFIRVHRSFIVAVDKISAYNAAQIEIRGYKIPIGRSYKDQVMLRL